MILCYPKLWTDMSKYKHPLTNMLKDISNVLEPQTGIRPLKELNVKGSACPVVHWARASMKVLKKAKSIRQEVYLMDVSSSFILSLTNESCRYDMEYVYSITSV